MTGILYSAADSMPRAESSRPHKPILPSILARITWKLGRAGVRLIPYYWFEESRPAGPGPALDRASDFTFGFLTADDLHSLARQEPEALPPQQLQEYLARLEAGKRFYGARYRGEIVALTFVDLDGAVFLRASLPLSADEAYLGDMMTRPSFRGRNIAPYLRCRLYEVLNAMGRTRFYSYSEAFNAPAIRFKQKLGAKPLRLGLYVELFGRYARHFRLKTYGDKTAAPGHGSP